MNELVKTKLAHVFDRSGRVVALTTAAVLVPVASAQRASTGTTIEPLSYNAWIDALQDVAVETINGAGPALFGLMAIIGGVYFVWNRVRSLW